MKDMMAVLRLTSSRYRPVLLSKSLISVCQTHNVSETPSDSLNAAETVRGRVQEQLLVMLLQPLQQPAGDGSSAAACCNAAHPSTRFG